MRISYINSAALGWHGKYKTDVFGVPIRDEEGKPILSDDYDRDVQYIPRSQRPEWAAIGLVGRLIVCDNGKCTVGGYVSARNGVAVPTRTKTNVRVLRRVDDTHIEVLIRCLNCVWQSESAEKGLVLISDISEYFTIIYIDYSTLFIVAYKSKSRQ